MPASSFAEATEDRDAGRGIRGTQHLIARRNHRVTVRRSTAPHGSPFQLLHNFRNLAEVVVELVVATGQAMDLGLRNRLSVKVGMWRRHDLVPRSMKQMDRNAGGKPHTEVAFRCDVVARPAAFAD